MQFSPAVGETVPRKVEWALINKHKAQEYERLKQIQKIKDRQKKQAFKHQLDNQINGKNNINKIEREEDKKYYDFISMKAQQMKQRQMKQKYEKMIKRRTVQEENQYLLYQNTVGKSRNTERQQIGKTSLEVGVASARQRQKISQLGKKTILDALDKQLYLKQEQNYKQKLKDMKLEEENKKIQQEYFQNRNKNTKNYKQNPYVYQYYQELNMQKGRRQKDLQNIMIDDAALKKQAQQFKRKSEQLKKKHFLQQQMKQTLDQQVQFHNYQKYQQGKTNPQQNSYSVIGSMFRNKEIPYDKRQYSEYLRRQAQQQKLKKNLQDHMSEEEYKFNLNQLNKAVTGNYAQQNYQDRSLIAIGEKQSKLNLSTNNDRQDLDSEIIRQKLQSLKNRRRNQSAQSKSVIS